jgi:hypothetical protein
VLGEDEICPDVTYEQHAESLAMFELRHDNHYSQELLTDMTDAWVQKLKYDESVSQPYAE